MKSLKFTILDLSQLLNLKRTQKNRRYCRLTDRGSCTTLEVEAHHRRKNYRPPLRLTYSRHSFPVQR